MPASERSATEECWRGEETLVIGLDIGTTNSAASIVHLEPGCVPVVRVVSSWPSSPNSSKIPSAMLFDGNGEVKAHGAEVNDEARFGDDLADGLLVPAVWWKLHLHPPLSMPPPYPTTGVSPSARLANRANVDSVDSASFQLPPLPPGVTIIQCYSSMMKYLFTQTRAWFMNSTTNGEEVWRRLGADRLHFVLAHPNGWSNPEQQVLQQALLDAGLLRFNQLDSHLRMVTEAEASVHFSLLYGGVKEGWLKPGQSFCVVDAGGSTVDVCVYTADSVSPKLVLREAKTSDCTQSGGIFVTRAAEEIITRKLGDSPFNAPEYLMKMVEVFDTKVKINFDGEGDKYLIPFGFAKDNDPDVGIARGRLTLTNAEVSGAFAPSVDRILASVRSQVEGSNVQHILLVGGFGESPYLQRQLRATFERGGKIKVLTADEPSKKAVAEGCGVFFFRDTVIARATRLEFGLCTNRPYDPQIAGSRPIIVFSGGRRFLQGGWTRVVAKGTVLEADVIHREHFWVHKKPTDSMTFKTSVLCYDGAGDASSAHNGWCKDPQGRLLDGFREACTITGDLSPIARASPVLKTPTGEKFRELDFSIGIFFGGTSLKAALLWTENGKECRGAATVVAGEW